MKINTRKQKELLQLKTHQGSAAAAVCPWGFHDDLTLSPAPKERDQDYFSSEVIKTMA